MEKHSQPRYTPQFIEFRPTADYPSAPHAAQSFHLKDGDVIFVNPQTVDLDQFANIRHFGETAIPIIPITPPPGQTILDAVLVFSPEELDALRHKYNVGV